MATEERDVIGLAFAVFDALNPHVYEELERRAIALLRAGARRIGVKAIYEAMRYDRLIATRGDDFKLNNYFTALYARKLLVQHPELEDVIETRVRRVEQAA